MECPNCKSEDVEYEECLVSETDLVKVINVIPAAIYQCQECGCEFQWIKGQRLQIISEGIEHFDY